MQLMPAIAAEIAAEVHMQSENAIGPEQGEHLFWYCLWRACATRQPAICLHPARVCHTLVIACPFGTPILHAPLLAYLKSSTGCL